MDGEGRGLPLVASREQRSRSLECVRHRDECCVIRHECTSDSEWTQRSWERWCPRDPAQGSSCLLSSLTSPMGHMALSPTLGVLGGTKGAEALWGDRDLTAAVVWPLRAGLDVLGVREPCRTPVCGMAACCPGCPQRSPLIMSWGSAKDSGQSPCHLARRRNTL